MFRIAQTKKLFGRRIIKSSLAVALSIMISQSIGLRSPLLSGIAAFITITHSISSSYKAAFNRVFGTLLGGLLGGLFQFLGFTNGFAIGFALFLLINVFIRLKWQDSIVTAGIVTMSVMLFNPVGEDITPMMFTLHTVLDNFVGVIVGFLVNYYFLPPNQERFLVMHYGLVLQTFREKVLDLLEHNHEIQLSPIVKELNAITLETLSVEKDTQFLHKDITLAEIWEVNTQFYRAFSLLTQITQRERLVPLSDKNKKDLEILLGREIHPLTGEPHKEYEVIYNYHVESFIKTLRVITEEISDLSYRIEKQNKKPQS